MPRLINRAPNLRRHATGQGVVTLGGRDHYCGRIGSADCRERYRRLVQEWFAAGCIIPPAATVVEPLLVKELIAGYWQHAKGYYRHPSGAATSTLSTLKPVLRGLHSLYGNLPATEFGPRRLQALRETWVQAGHPRTTCNAYAGHIVRCFRWGAAGELIPRRLLPRA